MAHLMVVPQHHISSASPTQATIHHVIAHMFSARCQHCGMILVQIVPQLSRLIMLYVKVFQHSVTNNGEVTFSCMNISPSLRLYMPRFQDRISTGELIRKPTQSCLTISRPQGKFTISLEMGMMA